MKLAKFNNWLPQPPTADFRPTYYGNLIPPMVGSYAIVSSMHLQLQNAGLQHWWPLKLNAVKSLLDLMADTQFVPAPFLSQHPFCPCTQLVDTLFVPTPNWSTPFLSQHHLLLHHHLEASNNGLAEIFPAPGRKDFMLCFSCPGQEKHLNT